MVVVSDKELLEDIQRVAVKLGKTPTAREYDRHGSFARRTASKRFGCWNNALRKAELNINKRYDIDTEDLLKDIANYSHEGIAPTPLEWKANSKYSLPVVFNNCETWWKATVQAGLKPQKRRPLEPKTFHEYFEEVNDLSPTDAFPLLLFMFTGIDKHAIVEMNHDWLRQNRDRNIVRVPAKYSGNDRPWLFRMPETWHNPHTGDRIQTRLPQTVDWVLENHNGNPYSGASNIEKKCLRVAQSADIDNRETRKYPEIGNAPVVRPADLSYTHGVNLAQQNVAADSISKRLGTDGFRGRFDTDDILLWHYIRSGDPHSEYDPPNTFLDPV